MAKKKDRYIVGLDVGTHKVCAIVAEMTDEGRLDVIGIGQAESKGLRKGVVINLEATVDSIKRVVEEAELMAGVEIGSAYVGLAGTHIRGFNSRGVIAVSNKNRIIEREDVARVIEAAKAVSIPLDREILHVLPQEFVVDDQDGIGDPSGMTGTRLEVNVHVITCASTAAQNTVTCVNRAGLEVTDTVLTQLSAAEACLTADEKELGVALVDIGGGTTDLAIFEKGSLWHTAVLQVGGEHFTNDVAVALRTPVNEAEKIKKKHGCALVSMIPEVPLSQMFGYVTTLRTITSGRASSTMEFSHYAEVPKAMAEEVIAKVKGKAKGKAKAKTKTPDALARIRKVDLALVVPARTENLRHMLDHERVGLGRRDRVHVHRLQLAGKPHAAGLVGFDDHVADAAVDGELQQVVDHFRVRCDGRHGREGRKALRIPYFAVV